MTESRDADIALAAAKEAVRQCMNETFALLGVNLSNFDDVKKFREDIEFVRSLRTGATKVGAKFVLTVVSIIAGAIAIGAWETIKQALHSH